MYALVKGGVVLNVIVADVAFIEQHGAAVADGGEWVNVSDDALNGAQRPGPGWTYNKGAFAPPVAE